MISKTKNDNIKKIEDKRYLIYVNRHNIFRGKDDPKYKTDVYDFTGDVFHAMGEIQFRSDVKIERITYNEWTPEREKFWIDNNIKIQKWVNKYS